MIIIRISGGIGNQLFQYALGRVLSLRTGVELKLDTHFYGLGIEPDRSFQLPRFSIPGISAMIAGPADFEKIGVPYPARRDIFSKVRRALFRLMESTKPLWRKKTVLEPAYSFCPDILKIDGDCYLSGVWQSERYFSTYAGDIRRDLRLSAPLSPTADASAEKIRGAGGSSISLHVRRGDQVADPRLLKKHGALGEGYYDRAIDHIRKTVPSPHLFIFSDDIEWCRANMTFDVPTTYVSNPGIADYEELVLMSFCAHNIIAKSSFSWWGAWLNEHPDKIVVAPHERFGTPDLDADDLIPESWIKI